MGGGISRLTNHANRRKSEENNSTHRNNDRDITENTFSIKLLDNQREKKDNPHHLNSKNKPQTLSSPRKSVSSPRTVHHKNDQIISSSHQSISSPKNTAKTIENPKLEQKNESTDVFESNNGTPTKNGLDEQRDDDYGRRISDYDGLIGSPSFREYCVKDYLKTDGKTSDGEKIEGKPKVEKLITSSKAKEDSSPASAKKMRRKRGMKKVISMGNPSAMRNLLHISACYNPHVFASREKPPKPIEEND